MAASTKSIPELNRDLYMSLDRFNRDLKQSYPHAEIVFDTVMHSVEVRKSGELIKGFKIEADNAQEWASQEGEIWRYLADLVLNLSQERMNG